MVPVARSDRNLCNEHARCWCETGHEGPQVS
jgi:hypothetical protein